MDANIKSQKFIIEWHSIVRDLFRNAVIIFMAFLIGVMGVYIFDTVGATAEYTSNASLVVRSKSGATSTYTGLAMSSEMAEIYTNIFKANIVKERAAEHLGFDRFDGAVSAKVITNTNIIQLSVTAGKPQLAYDLITSILDIYLDVSENIFENAVVDVLIVPEVPHGKSNTLSTTNKGIISIAFALLAIACVVLLSILRDTVKNEHAFNTKVDSTLFGSIPHEPAYTTIPAIFKRQKKSLLIYSSAFVGLKFVESYGKLAAKIEYLHRQNGDKVFAITSVAENEGKSTTASNIAIALAAKDKKVVLLDLDMKKPSLAKVFGFEDVDNGEFFDMISGKFDMISGRIDTKQYHFRRYKKSQLYVAVNMKPHRDFQKFIENGRMKKIIESFKEQFDFIIIDTAPLAADSTVTDTVKMADKTILVVRTDVVPVAAINDTIIGIRSVGGKMAGCVLNEVWPDFNIMGQMGLDEGGYYSKKRYGLSYHKYGKYNKYGHYYGQYGKYSPYNAYSRYGKYSNYNYGNYGDYGNYGNYGKYTATFGTDDEEVENESNG
jgi:capsular exopolysaccharide synthesis family protein